MNFIFSFQEQDTLFSDSFIFLNKENIYSSMNLCKDYGKVFLYTTDSFYKKIKNYIPLNTEIKIMELDINKLVWSQIKFFSILDNIQKYNQPFFHLDFDFFLLENLFYKIPEVVVTGQEYYEKNDYQDFNGYYGYGKHYKEYFNFFEKENFTDLKELNCGYAYNCSIIGGKNLNLFKKWTEKSITLASKYKSINLPQNLNPNRFCSIIEQSSLAKICYDENINPLKLSETKNNISTKEKFLHNKFFGPEIYYNQSDDPNFIYRLYDARVKYLKVIDKSINL